mmetsp:Transcript_22676/g.21850  ORF Transcript_22676/g.21850 Transcript_22676/m.21850 type:complete len:81 (-) Transcript_22676:604-846(-)
MFFQLLPVLRDLILELLFLLFITVDDISNFLAPFLVFIKVLLSVFLLLLQVSSHLLHLFLKSFRDLHPLPLFLIYELLVD